mgnify:CR=1 FL=1
MCATADSQATVACNAAVAHKVRSYRGKVHPGPVHDSGVGAMSLYAELKRRNVFKVGAAYLVVAWLVVQAASIAFPTFEAPAWALRVFIFVVMLGFPMALVIAWMLQMTPEGVRVEHATGRAFTA